jgi:hypothetical protein
VDVFAHFGLFACKLTGKIARGGRMLFAIAQNFGKFTPPRAEIQCALARPMRARGGKFGVNRGRAWV